MMLAARLARTWPNIVRCERPAKRWRSMAPARRHALWCWASFRQIVSASRPARVSSFTAHGIPRAIGRSAPMAIEYCGQPIRRRCVNGYCGTVGYGRKPSLSVGRNRPQCFPHAIENGRFCHAFAAVQQIVRDLRDELAGTRNLFIAPARPASGAMEMGRRMAAPISRYHWLVRRLSL